MYICGFHIQPHARRRQSGLKFLFYIHSCSVLWATKYVLVTNLKRINHWYLYEESKTNHLDSTLPTEIGSAKRKLKEIRKDKELVLRRKRNTQVISVRKRDLSNNFFFIYLFICLFICKRRVKEKCVHVTDTDHNEPSVKIFSCPWIFNYYSTRIEICVSRNQFLYSYALIYFV